MAKVDTVYSLFGMKSPQQVARERLMQQQDIMKAYQRDPFQSAGAAIGMGLARLFGGPDAEMQKAQELEAITQSAQMDYQREKRIREAEAKAAQQAEIDARLGGIEGALATEAGPGTLPEVTVAEPSREEQMMLRFEDNANMYDMMAERYASMGYTSEANSARNAATEQRLKGFALQKTLAEIRAEEAKAATAKAPTTRTRIEGDEKIVEQWDGSKWNFVSKGARYKPAGAIDPITEAFGEQTVKKFGEYETQLMGAERTLNNLSTMEGLLNDKIITGTFAKSRLAVEKALAQAGIIDGTRIANTEAFMATAAKETLSLLGTGALGSGTAVSDKDREFMEKVVAGDIALTEESIRRIIRINRQVAQEAYGTYNTFVDTAKARFPEQGALFGGTKYYQGQRAKLKDGTVVVYDSKLGWVEQ